MSSSRAFVLASMALALTACCASQPPLTANDPSLPFDRPPPRMLHLSEQASGDTRTPDGRASSSCKNGGRAGQSLDHLYGFEVNETASYRFSFQPTFDGVIQIQQHHPEKPWYFGVGCMGANPKHAASLSLALEPGLYWVVVDGNLWDENGPYTLKVDIDKSVDAQIGAENPQKIAKLYETAPALKIGERHYGRYRSAPGEARTSCGVLNGNGVQKLSLDHKAKIKLRAAAQFAFAMELRPSAKDEKPICLRTAKEHYDAEIVADLGPGDYWVVLDALSLPTRDPYGTGSQPLRQRGAYIVDVEEVSP